MKKFMLLLTLLLFGCEEEPKILELIGEESVTISVNSNFIDEGVNLAEGEYAVTGSVDTSTPGTYKLLYSTNDGQQVIRTIVVEEVLVQEFIMHGDKEVEIELGTVYQDRGYRVNFGSVEVTNDVDTSTVGEYEVTYDCDAGTFIRIVHVVDTVAPELKLVGETLQFGNLDDLEDDGYEVDDISDDVTVTLKDETDKNGVRRTITYTATDGSGNSVEATRVIYSIAHKELMQVHSVYGFDTNGNMFTNLGKYTFNSDINEFERVYDNSFDGLNFRTESLLDVEDNKLLFRSDNGKEQSTVLAFIGDVIWEKQFPSYDVKNGIIVEDGILVLLDGFGDKTNSGYIEKYSLNGKLMWSNRFDEYGTFFVDNLKANEEVILVDIFAEGEDNHFHPVSVEMNHNGEIVGEANSISLFSSYKTINDIVYASGSYKGLDGVFRLDDNLEVEDILYQKSNFIVDYFGSIDDSLFIILGHDFRVEGIEWIQEHYVRIVTSNGSLIEEIFYDNTYKEITGMNETDGFIFYSINKGNTTEVYSIKKVVGEN